LLAIIDHIEAGLDLLLDDGAQRRAPFRLDGRRIDGFAAHAPGEQRGQRRRSRQASGMRGQDAIFTALHCCRYPLLAAPLA
jgi:hypothetical protein